MSSDTARVYYFDRQYLRLDEFVDEQAYHLAAHRRHNIGPHTWGIVSGLELQTNDGGQPVILPGFAIDGYGRDLLFDRVRSVPVSAFDELLSEEIAVWLVYDRFGSDPIPTGYARCDVDGTDRGFTREQECPRIITTIADPDTFDPRAPDTVPEADQSFPPHRTPPDSVSDDWPVFIGRITRDTSDPANWNYTFDLKGRPYVGVVAASLSAPALFDQAATQVVLGGDHGNDKPAFRIMVPTENLEALEPALEIEAQGPLTVHGEVSVRGDLEIEGGVLEFGIDQDDTKADDADTKADDADNSAQPWRIYRTHQDSVDGQTESLRIEIGAEGSEVVVGFFSEDDGFSRCLTIDSNCKVTVHGDLVVEGSIAGPNDEPKPRLTRGFEAVTKQQLTSIFSSGITGSNIFIEAVLARLARLMSTESVPSAGD